MKALIQRVSTASVTVAGETVGKIERGLLVFLGVEKPDTQIIAQKLLSKVLRYRVFNDAAGHMNLDVAHPKRTAPLILLGDAAVGCRSAL